MSKIKFTRLPIALVFIFISLSVFGQKNNIKGHVITQQDDKIEGAFVNLDWERNPETILFKPDGADMREYSVQELKSFFVETNGVLFERHALPEAEGEQERQVFLRVLVRGTKNLFSWRPVESKQLAFYIGEPGSLKPIYLQIEETNDRGLKGRLIDSKESQNQLIGYLIECTEIVPRVRSTSNTIGGMKKLFKSYKNCFSEASFTYEEELVGIENTFGVSSSYFSGTLQTEGRHSFDRTSGVSLGVFWTRPIGFGKNRALAFIGINYLGIEHNGSWSTSTTTNKRTYSSNYLQTRLAVRYSPLRNNRLFLQAGIVLGLRVSNNIEQRVTLLGGEPRFAEVLDDGFRKEEIGINLGLGYRFTKNISFYFGTDQLFTSGSETTSSITGNSDIDYLYAEINVSLFNF